MNRRKMSSSLVMLLMVFLLAFLTGCSGDENEDPAPVTPTEVPWRAPEVAISLETSAQVRLTGVMRQHQRTVNGLAFSSNGTRLASFDAQGAEGMVVIWNLANGQMLFAVEQGGVRDIFFGPDDQTLITVDQAGIAVVWEMDMGVPRELRELRRFPTVDDPVAPQRALVAQSAQGDLLAFGTENGEVLVWRVPEGELVARMQPYEEIVQDLAFSPDGRWLAATNRVMGVRVWEIADTVGDGDGDTVDDQVEDEAEDEAEDGTGEGDGDEVEPAIPTYDLAYTITSTVTTDITPIHTVFSPDSQSLAIANQEGIIMWDLVAGEERYFSLTGQNAVVNALRFSPDGSLLAGCGSSPNVGLWQAATGDSLGGVPMNAPCGAVGFSSDNALLLTLPVQGQNVFLWDLTPLVSGESSGTPAAEATPLSYGDRNGMRLIEGTTFHDVVWSADGRMIILTDQLGPIYMIGVVP
ncbi:MAG: hypothetical protein GYB65_14270 [Chloroflexi bacterium]|nr:hypothetical protein [Chloroflexota bacterium]